MLQNSMVDFSLFDYSQIRFVCVSMLEGAVVEWEEERGIEGGGAERGRCRGLRRVSCRGEPRELNV